MKIGALFCSKIKAGTMPIFSRSSDQWLLGRISKTIGPVPIRIAFGDGEAISLSDSPAATVIIPDRKILARLLLDPEVAFGDGYADGTIEVLGNLSKLVEAIYKTRSQENSRGPLYSRLASKWTDWLQS